MGRIFFVPALVLCLVSCMKQDDFNGGDFDGHSVKGFFIINEGTYASGNASLSWHDTGTGETLDNVFYGANRIPLGDTARSMTISGDTGWIVVNNSKVIFAVDMADMRLKGRITGFTSPRNMMVLSDTKAYVTEMYDNRIVIVNPRTYEIAGYIETGCSTEQMILHDGYVYVNFWSSGNMILKIDPVSDTVVDKMEVGLQPCGMALDTNNRLWVLSDGSAGWTDNPAGHETPSLCMIDLETFTIEKKYVFDGYESVNYSAPSDLHIDGTGTILYWMDGGVWKMGITAASLPDKPLIHSTGDQSFYSMTIDPENGDIFVGDAIDYSQNGKVYRYSSDGTLLEKFGAGICPGDFCWY